MMKHNKSKPERQREREREVLSENIQKTKDLIHSLNIVK